MLSCFPLRSSRSLRLCVEIYLIRLIDARAGFADEFFPLGRFDAPELGELLGGAAGGFEALRHPLLTQILRRYALGCRFVQLRENFRGRAGWRVKRKP